MSKKNKVTLLDAPITYRPMHYPWCHDAWLLQQQIHWLPEEVPMGDDVKDWQKTLSDEEKNLLTHIFRFFTQADIEVFGAYAEKYPSIFKPNEVKMMLAAFGNMETIHVVAYAHLIDTLSMPESTFSEFLEYKEMKDKYNDMQQFNMESKEDIAFTLAGYGAFQEGLTLFASFAMLLNFSRFNKMKGMCTIIEWSLRDEAVIKGTEVLCSDGKWKKIEELTLSDKILQYSMEDRTTEFVNPQKIKHVKRDKTYSYIGENFEQIVSPNHRMIIEKNNELAESTGEKLDVAETFNFILNGNKKGSLHNLTKKQKELCIMSAKGESDLDWVCDLLEIISKSWCKEFMDLYFENVED